MMTERTVRTLGAGMLCMTMLLGCDDAAGPGGTERVAVEFAAVRPSAAQGSMTGGSLELRGSNGTLVIDELRLIVAEFELERVDDDSCDDDAGSDDDCEEFEAGPAFVNVPLNGSGTIAVQHNVAPGTYDEMEFEIEDLEDDEDDAVMAQRIAALRAQILAQFPDWPREASILVKGTFTPTGGAPQPFRVYFAAEIEIERDLTPPVRIDGSGGDATFTVQLDPVLLFRNPDGSLRNLAAFDFDATGRTVRFELEIENGISRVEYRER